jgi:thioredoxin-like negative regulator of GroEL
MDSPTRREKLEAMLADEPGDQFLRYALALELEKEGEHERSMELLRSLMAQTPPHVPSFFRAGQHLARQGRTDEARALLREGIEEARRQGESHAASEMGTMLANLGG